MFLGLCIYFKISVCGIGNFYFVDFNFVLGMFISWNWVFGLCFVGWFNFVGVFVILFLIDIVEMDGWERMIIEVGFGEEMYLFWSLFL